MAAALGAIAPIFLLLVLGFVLGRLDFPGPGFWPLAERLVYVVLFPALLFRSAAGIEADGAILAIAAAVLGPILLVMALIGIFGSRLGLGPLLLPAVAQAAPRQNVYIAFATALGVWGEPALLPLSIAVAAYAPGSASRAPSCSACTGRHGRGPPHSPVPLR
jgi:predicted permease